MRIPHTARVCVLVIGATSFYTYVGQMVPQKEVLPPQETVIRADLTTADMVKVGREIMDGKGLCFTCHTIGKTGALRFPDLEGVATRAATRVPAGLALPSGTRVSTRAINNSVIRLPSAKCSQYR